jgi:rhodanese-related sulfurtransferase
LPTRITREDLQGRLARSDRPVLVEALGAAFYEDAHLPGAINIPPGQVDRLARQLIPDRDSPVVVYCSGSCSSADAVARRLEAVGYTNVALYTGGKEDWVEHGLPIERSEG